MAAALLHLLGSCSALTCHVNPGGFRTASRSALCFKSVPVISKGRGGGGRRRSLCRLSADDGRLAEVGGDDAKKSGRKRRMRGKRALENINSSDEDSSSVPSSSSSMPLSSSPISKGTVFMLDDKLPVLPTDAAPKTAKPSSKLPPLTGSLEARQANFNEKSGVERALEEYLAPTPAGKEPKFFQLMKTITWGAVILLVLTEIVVSLKVGGAPFDLGKVSLPSLPKFSLFDIGKDLQ